MRELFSLLLLVQTSQARTHVAFVWVKTAKSNQIVGIHMGGPCSLDSIVIVHNYIRIGNLYMPEFTQLSSGETIA